MWEFKKGDFIDSYTHTSEISSLAINSKGTMLVAGTLDKLILVFDLTEQLLKFKQKLEGHRLSIWTVTFSIDDK